jgi:DNA-directed RNA polymerase subunit beta
MVLSSTTPSVRKSYGQIADKLQVGNLIQTQLDSFEWFKREGLRELFNEINPITDYTGKNYELRFLDYEFGPPKFDEEECRQRDMTFSAPLRINTRLHIKTGENAGEIKEAEVFMGDFAMMTPEGTFIVNGTERVVVSQLVRSPGVYFTSAEDRTSGRTLFAAKLIPNRGAWLEIETSNKDILTVKIDRKRKVPVTTLVRALGYGGNDDIKAFFADVDTDPDHQYIQATLDKDPTTSVEEALVELYRKIRPGWRTRATCSPRCSSTRAGSTSPRSAALSWTRTSASSRTKLASAPSTKSAGCSTTRTSSRSSASSSR